MRSRHEPSEERSVDARSAEDEDCDAWVLLAETRTVRLMGKWPASREAHTDKTDSGSDGNPSQAVRKRATSGTTEVVVPGRQRL